MNKKLTYLPEFDGVRAIAALMVMFFHFFQHLDVKDGSLLFWVRKFAFFGQTGVTLFFVLSGFLITRILLTSRDSDNYFKSFYLRRSLRIFPLYYFFLILYYFVVPLIFSDTPAIPFSQQWPYWIYLQNFAITFNWASDGPFHYWSLAVEEHFYLVWPLVIYFLSEKNLVRVIYGVILLSVLLRAYLFSRGYEVFFFTFTNIDALAIGALLAIQESRTDNALSPKKFIRLFFIFLLPTLAMWFLLSGLKLDVVQWVKVLFITIIYYSILGYLLSSTGDTVIKKILRSRPFEFTGRISYGLYVYHPLCFALMGKYLRFHYVAINFVLAFLVAYLTAGLSFYLFESHFLKLKKYFNY